MTGTSKSPRSQKNKHLKRKQGNQLHKQYIYDSNNKYLYLLTITSFVLSCYLMLSYNNNFPYFNYYNSYLLIISSLIFIISGGLCNIIISTVDIPTYYPHPIFWRMYFCFAILYASFLSILLIQPTLNDIRNLFKIFDSTLNTPIQTKSYATDCWNFSYELIAEKFDAFVIGHFVGWMFGGLLLRNRELLWFTQVSWEFIEIITYYFIPNFGECWWDQIILDIFLCNGLGLEIGVFLAGYLGLEMYECCNIFSWENIKFKTCKFLGFKINDNQRQKALRSVNPKKRGYFEEWKHISEYFWILFGIPFQTVMMMMNGFLIKLWLWIPTEHWWNIVRLFCCCAFAIAGLHQYLFGSIYYNRGKRVRKWSGKIYRFGKQCYLWLIVMGLELCVIYRAVPPIPSDKFPLMPMYNMVWLTGSLGFIILYSWILCRAY